MSGRHGAVGRLAAETVEEVSMTGQGAAVVQGTVCVRGTASMRRCVTLTLAQLHVSHSLFGVLFKQ